MRLEPIALGLAEEFVLFGNRSIIVSNSMNENSVDGGSIGCIKCILRIPDDDMNLVRNGSEVVQAQIDIENAFILGMSQKVPNLVTLSSTVSGLVVNSGIYTFASGITVTGKLVVNSTHANSVVLFQLPSNFSFNGSIELIKFM